jgi:hypothetical protein
VRSGRAAIIALTRQAASNRAASAVSGTVDGHVEIFFSIFNDDIWQMRDYDLDMTAFVLAAAWAVDVRQAHPDALDVLVSAAQSKTQAAFNMTAQGIRQ